MNNLEKCIIDKFKKHSYVLAVVIMIFASLIVRLKCFYFESSDFVCFLYEWFRIIKEFGGLGALCGDYYNYYIPYMCVIALPTYFQGFGYNEFLVYIKVVSVIFEYLCAFAGLIMAKKILGKGRKSELTGLLLLACILFSPSTIVDGALWAQCDYIYAFWIIASLYFLINEKYNFSFLFLGIAFIFKLQTIFIFPVFIIVYACNRRFSIVKFLWIAFLYILGGVPTVILGKGIKNTYSIYLGQASNDLSMTANAPNFWTFLPDSKDTFFYYGLALVAVIFMLILVHLLVNEVYLDTKCVVYTSVVSTGICFMFMPCMHERYASLWLIMAYITYVIYDKKKLVFCVVLDLISVITYCAFLFPENFQREMFSYPIMAIIRFVILGIMIFDWISILKDSKKNEC